MQTETPNIDHSVGFITALNEVIRHLKEVTNFNPDNRFIDSISLILWIQERSDEVVNQEMAVAFCNDKKD